MTMGKITQMAAVGLLVLAGGSIGCGGSSSCGGNIAAEWFLTANGSQVSCLPGDEVDINVDSVAFAFACSDMAGTTPNIAAGRNRNVSLTLLDSSANVLSQTQTMAVFMPCNTITDVGQVEFSVTP